MSTYKSGDTIPKSSPSNPSESLARAFVLMTFSENDLKARQQGILMLEQTLRTGT